MSVANTRFSQEQLVNLQSALGFSNSDQTLSAAAYISGLLVAHDQLLAGKALLPTPRDVEASKRRLERLATAAGLVADLLEAEPAAGLLYAGDEDWPRASPLQVSRLVADLRRISHRASAVDDFGFRVSRGLLPAGKAGKSTYAAALWPPLFDFWAQCGRRVAKTENGPLHRFIALVHSAGSLENPKASTLKEAVEAWRAGRA